jgi:hypothetical protein
MTLAQVAALIDGERRFHDPKAGSGSSRADTGTAVDLMMLSRMRVS